MIVSDGTAAPAFRAFTRRVEGHRSVGRTDLKFWSSCVNSASYEEVSSTTPPEQVAGRVYQRDAAEASTEKRETPKKLDQQIARLFEDAKEEFLEDAVEGVFAKGLSLIVKRYGNLAIAEIASFITKPRVSIEIASETLRWLARIEHAPSYAFRRWLIERSLQSESAIVRDSASLSLASLDDPSSASPLRQAIQSESCEELRQSMTEILSYLERNG